MQSWWNWPLTSSPRGGKSKAGVSIVLERKAFKNKFINKSHVSRCWACEQKGWRLQVRLLCRTRWWQSQFGSMPKNYNPTWLYWSYHVLQLDFGRSLFSVPGGVFSPTCGGESSFNAVIFYKFFSWIVFYQLDNIQIPACILLTVWFWRIFYWKLTTYI